MKKTRFISLLFLVVLFPFLIGTSNHEKVKSSKQEKMKIEIWSDVMCPFCYIGKRKIEAALAQFPHADEVTIEWKSFQLNPAMKTDPSKNVIEHLAETKQISLEQAKQMNEYVTKMAAEVGLTYDLNNAVVANSFNAHRLTHFAKTKGKQLEAEEALFKAYFTDGKNTDDLQTLLELGVSIGLPEEETRSVLESSRFTEDVNRDIQQAQQLGIRGVPFFLFDGKYAISGAQERSVFQKTLAKAHSEWKEEQKKKKIDVVEGAICKPDGTCE